MSEINVKKITFGTNGEQVQPDTQSWIIGHDVLQGYYMDVTRLTCNAEF